jgi:hypothetical protein
MMKLSTLLLGAPADGSAPSIIKIFVNQPDLDFESARSGSVTPVQTFTLKESDWQQQQQQQRKTTTTGTTSTSGSNDANENGDDQKQQTTPMVHCLLKLYTVKFVKVTSIALLIESNVSNGDRTALSSISVIGSTLMKLTVVGETL